MSNSIEPIHLQGVKMLNSRLMTNGTLRITLELNENDKIKYCASIGIATAIELCFNAVFESTEVEGNNNGFEGSLLIPGKRKETIEDRFRKMVWDKKGRDYYIALKHALGIDHLRDLKSKHGLTEKQYESLLKLQAMSILNLPIDPGTLNHDLWIKIFNINI